MDAKEKKSKDGVDLRTKVPLRKSLRIKIVVLISSVIAFGAFIFVLISFQILPEKEISENRQRIQEETELYADVTTEKIEIISNDIVALSQTPPIFGLVRAVDNDGYDEIASSTYEQWKERLETIFVGLEGSKGYYNQLRYLDGDGKEIVRVDLNEGKLSIVEDESLQDKSDRYYFQEAKKLSEGELFVSRIDLNREGDPPEVEIPYNPVVRYVYPVHYEGEFRGAIVANVVASEFLETIPVRDVGEFFVVDKDGYYLHHSNAEKEWGAPHDLDTGENVRVDFPGEVEILEDTESGILEDGDSITAVSRVYLGGSGDNYVVLVRIVPKSIFLDTTYDLMYLIIVIVVAIVSFIVVTIFALVSYLSRPIVDLTKAVYNVADGDFSQKAGSVLDQKVIKRSKDELGVLAEAFNKMTTKLAESYGGLEREIAEKTKQLESEKSSLEEEVNKRNSELIKAKESLEETVQERTDELNKKVEEYEKINKVMMGREMKMIELKRDINELLKRLGESPKYDV